jgi:hypothetical protein
MNNLFIVLGYGVPKDIFKDENYNLYLKLAFNNIFDIVSKNNFSTKIIFCGGKTDCFKPFDRTEAEEMIKFFNYLKNRDYVEKQTKNWKLIPEKKSVSTLENLIFCKDIIKNKDIKHSSINIIFEKSRKRRIKTLAQKIFKSEIKLLPLDFNQSETRFIDQNFINKKEKTVLEYDLKSLKNEEYFNKAHKIYLEKLSILRNTEPKNREKAIEKWWKEKILEIK